MLGYKTLIVAPESSVEQVAEAGHLTRGRISTHMLLWLGATAGFSGEAMGLKPPWSRLGIPQWYALCSPRGCVYAKSSGGG
jgi:hypothetical protein